MNQQIIGSMSRRLDHRPLNEAILLPISSGLQRSKLKQLTVQINGPLG